MDLKMKVAKIAGFFRLAIVAPAAFTVASCGKTDERPPIDHFPLNDSTVRFGQTLSLDLDLDETRDIVFNTLLVGDPINQHDKRQWRASAASTCALLIDSNDVTQVFHAKDPIPAGSVGNFSWSYASKVMLVQKITPSSGPDFWDGPWKDAIRWYLPFQLRKQGLPYNGWIELSIDNARELLVLHRAAICRDAGKTIAAGD